MEVAYFLLIGMGYTMSCWVYYLKLGVAASLGCAARSEYVGVLAFGAVVFHNKVSVSLK